MSKSVAEIAEAIKLATKIEERAERLLEPMVLEMRYALWPATCKRIMWETIASKATRLAGECK